MSVDITKLADLNVTLREIRDDVDWGVQYMMDITPDQLERILLLTNKYNEDVRAILAEPKEAQNGDQAP